MGNAYSTYYAPYNSVDGDLVLLSSDGYRFRVNSFVLKTASRFFRNMDVTKTFTPAGTVPCEVPCDERHLVLKCMLDAVYPSQTISPRDLRNFDDFQDLCIVLAFKYDIEAGPAIVQKLFKEPNLYFSPILKFDLARRLGLEEEARAASSATLDLDLRTEGNQACLRRVQTSSALDIIKFHAERRNAAIDALPKTDELRHNYMPRPKFEVMKAAFLSQIQDATIDVLDSRPSGSGLHEHLIERNFKPLRHKLWYWDGVELTNSVIVYRLCEKLKSLPKEITTVVPPPTYSQVKKYGGGNDIGEECRTSIEVDERYNYSDADVELISSKGTAFRAHGEILKVASTYFREKIVTPHHDEYVAKAPRCIVVAESDAVLRALLDTIYPDRILVFTVFTCYEDFRQFIKLLDKGQLIESGRKRAKSIFYDPTLPYSCILKYGLARELGKPWNEQADLACAATLRLDLRTPQSQTDLYQIPVGPALDLLNLHTNRRKQVKEALIPPFWEDFGSFPRQWFNQYGLTLLPIKTAYSTFDIDLVKYAWANFRAVVLQEIDNVPSGETLQTEEFTDHLAYKVFLEMGQKIGMTQRSRTGLQEGLRKLIESLPKVP